jgi:16S rRNA (uracil1498-N3)-methyltransferase
MGIGSELVVFNESCGEWLSSIASIDGKKGIYVKCIENIRPASSDNNKLRIGFGMIKHDNMKWMIEKITELGVTEIFPLITEYTNIKDINVDKYNKIIIAAVEQSERITVPVLYAPIRLDVFLERHCKYSDWYVALERTHHHVQELSFRSDRCGFIVGPEGGFSNEERDKLLASPMITPLSISHNILRTETAAVACAAISRFVTVE